MFSKNFIVFNLYSLNIIPTQNTVTNQTNITTTSNNKFIITFNKTRTNNSIIIKSK